MVMQKMTTENTEKQKEVEEKSLQVVVYFISFKLSISKKKF